MATGSETESLSYQNSANIILCSKIKFTSLLKNTLHVRLFQSVLIDECTHGMQNSGNEARKRIRSGLVEKELKYCGNE